MNIYIDIETIPTQSEEVITDIAAGISHPANMTKKETIEKWEEEKKPSLVEKAVHKTGLSGTFGEVFTIGWAIEDQSPQVLTRGSLEDTEENLLKNFFRYLDEQMHEGDYGTRKPYFIGHNVLFDLRFLFHRSVVNGVRPLTKLPYNSTAWSGDYYDTMYEWAGLRDTISLGNLCKALGIPCKQDGMDGSKVWAEVKAGNIEKVVEYCADDVRAVRSVYKKLNFIREEVA